MTKIYYEKIIAISFNIQKEQNVLDRIYKANSRIETLEETWDYFSNMFFLYFLE